LLKNRFWDIWVVRQDGDWLAFRSPETSLRRVTGFFGVLLLLGLLATVGWVLSRWKVETLEVELAQSELELRSVEMKLRAAGNSRSGESPQLAESRSWVPSLDSSLLESGVARFSDVVVSFDVKKSELSLRFDIVRNLPTDGALKFYVLTILHGPQGMVVHPPALGSRSGDALVHHRGRLVEGVQTRRSQAEAFRLTGFFDRAGPEPVFATLLLFDPQGSLVARNRFEVTRLGGGS
jgi:hypothetical protein